MTSTPTAGEGAVIVGDIGQEHAAVMFEPIEGPAQETLVVDASALVFAATEGSPGAARLRHRLNTGICHAPHLIDAEFGNVLRRKVLRGEMSPQHAAAVLHAAPTLLDFRYEHHGTLGVAAWQLRNNISFYDALYVALAAALDVELLTADKRLASAPGLPCAVRSVG